MRSPVRLSLALIALGLPAPGLAVATSGSAPPSRASAEIERTIKKAVRVAVVDRNYRRACRFGTRTGRRRLLRGYNSTVERPYSSCAAIVRHEVGAPGNRFWMARLRDGVDVDVLWAQRGTARARVAEGPARFAGSGFVRLRRIDGRWRLHNSTLIPYGN